MDNNKPLRLRSYPSRYQPSLDCEIWEVARATSAAPTFFDPIQLPNGTTLRDGAFFNNNPIMELLDEIQTEFGGDEIESIVSIGTGVGKTEHLGSRLSSVAKACAKIATDTGNTEWQFRRTHASKGQQFDGCYFRFEVDQGLQGVGIEEWKKLDRLFSATTSYLDRQRELLKACVDCLAEDLSL
jgi:hypothetical protein